MSRAEPRQGDGSGHGVPGSKRSSGLHPGPTDQNFVLPKWTKDDIDVRLDECSKFLVEWKDHMDKTDQLKAEDIQPADLHKHISLKRKLHDTLGIMARMVQHQVKLKRPDSAAGQSTGQGAVPLPGQSSSSQQQQQQQSARSAYPPQQAGYPNAGYPMSYPPRHMYQTGIATGSYAQSNGPAPYSVTNNMQYPSQAYGMPGQGQGQAGAGPAGAMGGRQQPYPVQQGGGYYGYPTQAYTGQPTQALPDGKPASKGPSEDAPAQPYYTSSGMIVARPPQHYYPPAAGQGTAPGPAASKPSSSDGSSSGAAGGYYPSGSYGYGQPAGGYGFPVQGQPGPQAGYPQMGGQGGQPTLGRHAQQQQRQMMAQQQQQQQYAQQNQQQQQQQRNPAQANQPAAPFYGGYPNSQAYTGQQTQALPMGAAGAPPGAVPQQRSKASQPNGNGEHAPKLYYHTSTDRWLPNPPSEGGTAAPAGSAQQMPAR